VEWIEDSLFAAYYSEENNIIYMCETLLQEAYMELKTELKDVLTYEQYIEVVFMHEMGHALDPELKEINKLYDEYWKEYTDKRISKDKYRKETDKLILKREDNAWDIAEREFMTESNKELFRMIRKESTEEYKSFLKSVRKFR